MAGFTLIEIVLALFLVGMVLVLVLPKIGPTRTLPFSSRQLVGMMRSLFTMAPLSQQAYRLYVDLDQGAYWAVQLAPEGERPPSDPSLGRRIVLSPAIRFQDMTTFQQGKVSSGLASVQFFPVGRAEPAVIHLVDEEHNILTLLLNPLTGEVRVMDGYVEAAVAGVIPEHLRPFLILLPAPPPSTVPSGGTSR